MHNQWARIILLIIMVSVIIIVHNNNHYTLKALTAFGKLLIDMETKFFLLGFIPDNYQSIQRRPMGRQRYHCQQRFSLPDDVHRTKFVPFHRPQIINHVSYELNSIENFISNKSLPFQQFHWTNRHRTKAVVQTVRRTKMESGNKFQLQLI